MSGHFGADHFAGGDGINLPQQKCVSTNAIDIEAEAAKPQSTSVDGVTVTERSLKDQIEADRYAAAKCQGKNGYAFGIGLKRINPGSAVRE